MKTVTVVCPVYNEEAVIELFYLEVKTVLHRLADRYQSRILFVVDRSQDGTLDILKRIAEIDPDVMILALSSRFGHQMSLLAGIDHSDADAVIMMDSDLQHPPDLIPVMLQAYEQGYDIVYTLRQDTPEISWFKRTSSKLFYRIINRISEVPINESAADFRPHLASRCQSISDSNRERNLFFARHDRMDRIQSIALPFQVRKRPAGKSKYSIRRMTRFGVYGVVSFSKSPLQAAIVVGLAFAVFGFAFAFITVLQYFTTKALPPGWATLTILLSIFSGIQLVFMGIMGEYIGAIFDEVKARPHYIIDEQINFNEKIQE